MAECRGRIAGLHRVARACAVLIAALLALAGCGGDDDVAGSSEGACAFLTRGAVEEALGGPFAPPKRDESPSGGAIQVCNWYAEPGKAGRGFIQLTVSTFQGKGRRQFDNQRRITPGSRTIVGVGEGAFVSQFGRNTKVTTFKEDRLIEVLSVDEPTATELAKTVLERV